MESSESGRVSGDSLVMSSVGLAPPSGVVEGMTGPMDVGSVTILREAVSPAYVHASSSFFNWRIFSSAFGLSTTLRRTSEIWRTSFKEQIKDRSLLGRGVIDYSGIPGWWSSVGFAVDPIGETILDKAEDHFEYTGPP